MTKQSNFLEILNAQTNSLHANKLEIVATLYHSSANL
jgi:hypothetical protein